MSLDQIIVNGCSSSFSVHGWADYPPGSIYRARPSQWELVLLTRGGMRWELSGGAYEVSEGALCLVPGGVNELRRWDRGTLCRHGFLHLRVSAGAARALEKLSYPPFRPAGECAEARMLFRRLLARISAPGFSQVVALAELRLILALYLNPGSEAGRRMVWHSAPLVAAAVRQLQLIWGREGVRLVPLARWAAAVECSREHLCRTIRTHLSCTPRQLMQAMRANQALHLIRAANLRAKQIARKLGFGGENHLARLLRKHYGMAPNALRRWFAKHHNLPPARISLPLQDGISLFWDPETLRLE
jgi:AraC-like DNA-binding protein